MYLSTDIFLSTFTHTYLYIRNRFRKCYSSLPTIHIFCDGELEMPFKPTTTPVINITQGSRNISSHKNRK